MRSRALFIGVLKEKSKSTMKSLKMKLLSTLKSTVHLSVKFGKVLSLSLSIILFICIPL
jgi:hypothetical protein